MVHHTSMVFHIWRLALEGRLVCYRRVAFVAGSRRPSCFRPIPRSSHIAIAFSTGNGQPKPRDGLGTIPGVKPSGNGPQDHATSVPPADSKAGDLKKPLSNIDEALGQPHASPASSSFAPSRKGLAAGPADGPPRKKMKTEAQARDWEANLNWAPEADEEDLPFQSFGENQHAVDINEDLYNCLKAVVRSFPFVRFAFAYGSGVFPQSKSDNRVPAEEEIRRIHPRAPEAVRRAQGGSPKMIDLIFGVAHTQHWHSLNMRQNRDHYSALASLGSAAVAYMQDNFGAGVYFNPYVVVNGILVKYGVVSVQTLEKDLTEWDTLYLAGRLHKPVKIVRDDVRIRLANQMNLLSVLRTALLLLPPEFDEATLYSTITSISYLGDPRMALRAENPAKVRNIVDNNMANFRRLYKPLIDALPNLSFDQTLLPGEAEAFSSSSLSSLSSPSDLRLRQDMDPVRRGNMVRRLPKAFRARLYFQYQKKFAIPQEDFDHMMQEGQNDDSVAFRRREGGGFERRIAQDDPRELREYLHRVLKQTIGWPAAAQTLKGPLTSGVARTFRYVGEKLGKYRQGRDAEKKRKAGEKANGGGHGDDGTGGARGVGNVGGGDAGIALGEAQKKRENTK